MSWIKNRVLLLLLIIGAVTAASLPFLSHAPNRLVSGVGISLLDTLVAHGGLSLRLTLALALAGSFLLAAASVLRPGRATQISVIFSATLLLASLTWLAGSHAAALGTEASGSSGIQRTSLSGGFWLLATLCWLAASDAIGRLSLKPLARLLASSAVITPVLALIAGGALDALSLLREYANRQEVFNSALLQHLQIVLASLLPSLLIGVPLGIASARHGRWMNALRTSLFASLNIIQTIPSIALFGLLMAPLALLAIRVPLLGQWGIKGIGLAPAVLALMLYSLLPIVRSSAAGINQVPRPVIDAALGMGLSARQIFWQIEAPLALPVFMAGLRVATVQTIGLAVVAALIGAGGFGAIVFQGLTGGALDLVLLGVVPVVAMAVAVDAVLKAWALSLAQAL